jgi:hypothetical protein
VFLLWKQGPQFKQLPFETSGAKGAQISIHLKHFEPKQEEIESKNNNSQPH